MFTKVRYWTHSCSLLYWKLSHGSLEQAARWTSYKWSIWQLSLDMIQEKLHLWKGRSDIKGLKVNFLKTKLMVFSRGLNSFAGIGKYLCVVCCKIVGVNSIYCGCCHHLCSQKMHSDFWQSYCNNWLVLECLPFLIKDC